MCGRRFLADGWLERHVVQDAAARRVMTAQEAEQFVLALLANGQKHTTQQVDAASRREGKRCPDATVRFLAKLRLQGKIEGELSMAHRTWLWWHPDNPEAVEPPVES